jgi:G3E family GTPase
VRTDLVRTLLELEGRREAGEIAFARVLVETSGLADPAPILAALMSDAALAGRFAIGAVATLVDTELGEATLNRHPEARRQVAMADRILLTKTDRAAPSAALRARLAALNPAATPVQGPVDAGWLLAPAARLPQDFPPVALHTAGINSASIRRTEPVPALALTLLIQALAEHCGARLLRLKGLVDLAEAPGRPAVIHGVQHVFSAPEFLPAWPDEDRTTRIVLIGEALPPHFAARLLDAIIAEVQDETARQEP